MAESPVAFRQDSPSPATLASQTWPGSPGYRPSSTELALALQLLDSDGDGKILEADLAMLLELAYGVDTGRASGSGAAESWRRLMAACEGPDGLLTLKSLRRAMRLGILLTEVAKMPRVGGLCSGEGAAKTGQSPPDRAGHVAFFQSLSEHVEAFNRFDRDHNGVICAKDLQKALEEHTEVRFTLEECKDIIRRVDANSDGVVELTEFNALMKFMLAA